MKTIKRLVELSKRVLLGLTLGMLLVSCSTDPITEDQPQQIQPQIQINIPGPANGHFCTYTTYSHSVDIPPTGNLADVSLTATVMYYNRKKTISTNIRPDGSIIDSTKVTQSVVTRNYPGLSRFDVNTWICN